MRTMYIWQVMGRLPQKGDNPPDWLRLFVATEDYDIESAAKKAIVAYSDERARMKEGTYATPEKIELIGTTDID